jgi:hypothetical protein
MNVVRNRLILGSFHSCSLAYNGSVCHDMVRSNGFLDEFLNLRDIHPLCLVHVREILDLLVNKAPGEI